MSLSKAADAAPLSTVSDRFERKLMTPEGVSLHLRIASAGERAGALVVDLLIIFGTMTATMLVVLVVGASTFGTSSSELVEIIWLLFFFGLRNFYFFFFEAGRRAATPGKRLMKLRVAARDGGVLKLDAVFARNAIREVELFLPMGFLLSGGATGVDGWILIAGAIWCSVFVLLPLFNRDRLRAGDIVAGTWVVHTPRRKLLSDLASTARDQRSHYEFSHAELDAYGVKELQVLEQVIRAADHEACAAVSKQIRAKIGWQDLPADADLAFLKAYYSALRGRLEAGLLMGVRRADKHDRPNSGGRTQ